MALLLRSARILARAPLRTTLRRTYASQGDDEPSFDTVITGFRRASEEQVKNGNPKFTLTNEVFNTDVVLKTLELADAKAGSVETFFNTNVNTGEGVSRIIAVGIADAKPFPDAEEKHVKIHNARMAAALGMKKARAQGAKIVALENSLGSAQAIVEGAELGLYEYTTTKTKSADWKEPPKYGVFPPTEDGLKSMRNGKVQATAQNIARRLMETPANMMTPKMFVEEAQTLIGEMGTVTLNAYGKDWLAKENMGAVLAVGRGSVEEPQFLVAEYRGPKKVESTKPDFALVGKGVTFDAGGISIKPSAGMAMMRGDMGGAAVTLAAFYAIAALELPLHVTLTIPLVENLPSGNSVKPGDVVRTRSGMTVEVDNTDAEGRLILADAITYTLDTFAPKRLVDVATLTGATVVALGDVYTAMYTPSDKIANGLRIAGMDATDPVWRMPLHDAYLQAMKKSATADLINVGSREGGANSAAMFLYEFVRKHEVKDVEWCHLDIAGVMDSKAAEGYNNKGMTGRPTRMLIAWANGLAN
ncbi:hypothetical protein YB2330_004618 [Saitoella coloradoensis]